jgi:AcrR family transcriptional regulator
VAKARTHRTAWIEAGLEALAEAGPDAIRIESLARKLGVTKGGFYGYFADRDALLAEMLDTWEQASTRDVRDRLEAEGGDPSMKALRAGFLTFAPKRLRGVDLAVRDWSRRDPEIAARLRRVDSLRLDYLREQLGLVFDDPDDVEVRSLLALAVAVGMHYAAFSPEEIARLSARAAVIVSPSDTTVQVERDGGANRS